MKIKYTVHNNTIKTTKTKYLKRKSVTIVTIMSLTKFRRNSYDITQTKKPIKIIKRKSNETNIVKMNNEDIKVNDDDKNEDVMENDEDVIKDEDVKRKKKIEKQKKIKKNKITKKII